MGCASGAAKDAAPAEPGQAPFRRQLSREAEEWNFASALKASQVEIETINTHVLRFLDVEWPALKNSSLLSTWRERDQLMRQIGPPMMLLYSGTIAELGRIPHSRECRSITLEEASEIAERHGKRLFIEMFSHRWFSPDAMDDPSNSKAAALVEWANYRWSCGLATFFWVDFACINQDDIRPGIAMLPLYVASCNNIVCYDTPEYEPRAWCRLERVMFCSFVAPNCEFIGPGFVYNAEAERLPNGELKPGLEERALLPDPERGHLSFASDVPLVRDLKSLCSEHWGKCWKDGLMDIADSRGKLEGVRQLSFGATQVRTRRFLHSVYQAAGDDVLLQEQPSAIRLSVATAESCSEVKLMDSPKQETASVCSTIDPLSAQPSCSTDASEERSPGSRGGSKELSPLRRHLCARLAAREQAPHAVVRQREADRPMVEERSAEAEIRADALCNCWPAHQSLALPISAATGGVMGSRLRVEDSPEIFAI